MGTLAQAPGSGQKKKYTYDPADNILTLRRDDCPLVSHNFDPNSNRLEGNHDIVHDLSGHMLEIARINLINLHSV